MTCATALGLLHRTHPDMLLGVVDRTVRLTVSLMAASLVNVESIGSYFQSLSDPRHIRNRKHQRVDIIVIAVCGMICGSDGPTAIHRWAVERQEWLKTFLARPNGLPSRDCIRRLLMALRPAAFQTCCQAWIAAALPTGDGGPKRLVAIDGKTCKGSHAAAEGLGPLHIVSAWAGEEGIALGQVAAAEKSDEITAIPQLLQQLHLRDTIVTIDAMGCQKDIARDIVAGGGDFVLALKDNQPKLREAVEHECLERLGRDAEDLRDRRYETIETGHGRADERSYGVMPIPKDFALKTEWPWVKAIGYSVRITRHADGRETDEVRYDILSRYLSGKRFSEAVREHWSIESMHWVLDVTFREDDSRTRERTLGNNLSWLRRFAVTLLKRHPIKDSIRGKMLRCLMTPDFLKEILGFSSV